eukprot:1971752-Rhodomonas_salina.2
MIALAHVTPHSGWHWQPGPQPEQDNEHQNATCLKWLTTCATCTSKQRGTVRDSDLPVTSIPAQRI